MNDMRLIDADATLNGIDTTIALLRLACGKDPLQHKAVDLVQHTRDFVAKMTTIDAVPVVHCRDCKHWKKGDFMGGDTPDSLEYGGGCPLVRFARYESDFCSKGERKDGEG